MAALPWSRTMSDRNISFAISSRFFNACAILVSFRCGRTNGYGDIRSSKRHELSDAGRPKVTDAFTETKLDRLGGVWWSARLLRQTPRRQAEHRKSDPAYGTNRFDLVKTVAIQQRSLCSRVRKPHL